MEELVQLTFDRDWKKWSAGDIAGFSPDTAERLLNTRAVVSRTDDSTEGEKKFRVAHRTTDAEIERWYTEKEEAEPELFAIRFTRDVGRYSVGDIAWFEEHVCQRYLEKKEAVWHEEGNVPNEKMQNLAPLTRSKLIEAGINTDRAVLGMDDSELMQVPGIGLKTLEEIRQTVG